MNKFKAFSITMSSILVLGTASSSIVAVAESLDDSIAVESSGNDGDLNESFQKLKASTFSSTSLTNEQLKALEGLNNGTYSIKVVLNGSTKYIGLNEVDEKIVNHFKNQNVLTLVSNENEAVFVDVDTSDLIDDSASEVPGEKIIEENASIKSEDNSSKTKEKNSQIDTDSLPDPSYTPKEYNDEEEVSLPRSSEVDKLLHGGEISASLYNGEMYPSSSYSLNEKELYIVKSGDTFYTIAASFKLSLLQLREWNKHITDINNLKVGTKLAITRRGVETFLSDSDKARLYRGGAEPVYTIPQEFIDDIAPQAINVSNQNGEEPLWPSLMIAQAAHESNYGRSSLASPPYHNLSGIKGSHKGKSVLMWTWEVLTGSKVYVLAPFRHYPSYDASLQSYARLLRKGLSWDSKYYSGTWRSNTDSVWDVLENGGLRGYATDPNYYAAIKRIINAYDLTKYDTGNYYVRTGTFLGKTFTQLQIKKLSSINNTLDYRIELDTNKAPYSYRRIESTKEFLGETGAQKVIDQLRVDKGWGASMIRTNNGTERHRVRSGYFNTHARAETALKNFKDISGYSASIEYGSDGKYRILTGFFNGSESAKKGLAYMHELGWGASIIGTGNFTPHYVIRTGTFNTPNHVNSAESYFDYYGWGSVQKLTSRTNPYYRIYAEGFIYENQADTFVSMLSQKFNWGSTAFPIKK